MIVQQEPEPIDLSYKNTDNWECCSQCELKYLGHHYCNDDGSFVTIGIWEEDKDGTQ